MPSSGHSTKACSMRKFAIYCLAGSFGSLLMGLLNVWPSYTISLYTSVNTTVLAAPMSSVETSLLGSLPSLGAMLGTAVVGVLIDTLGRKKGGVCIVLPFVISWAIIEVSSTSILILAARFLGGMSGGAALVFAPIFISETAEDSIRGTLAAFPIIFYCLGVLMSYLLGWFLSYHTIIWVCLTTSIAGAVLCATVAESAVFFVKQNREEDARQAIAHYRGATPASKVVLEELSRLKQQLMPAVELTTIAADEEKVNEETEKVKLNIEETNPVKQDKMPTWKLLFVSPSSRQAFIVVGSTLSMQVLMGIVPVQVYAKELFAQAVPTVSSHLCSVLFALTLLSGSILTAAIADKAGRRILIISSSALVAVCMLVLGVQTQTALAPAWVTALMLLLYCFSFNCGAGTVPYVLLSEAFVPEVQNLASTLLVEWVWFMNFFLIGVFPLVTQLIGTHGIFYLFATAGAVNVALSFFIVPETKGLSNAQIQEALQRRK